MKKAHKDAGQAGMPVEKRSPFVHADGRLRLIWIWLIVAIVDSAWSTGFHWLWHALLPNAGDLLFIAAEGIGLLACAYGLIRLLHIHDHHGFYWDSGCKWLGIGIGMEIIASVICLAVDSLRLLNPIGSPAFSWNQLILTAIIIVEDLAAEMLLQNVLYCAARDRIQRRYSIAITAATAYLFSHAWSLPWIGMVNIILLSISCCLLHDRWGLAASAGFGIGWAVASNVILSEYGTGVWNIYHASESWLTGGGTGVFNGVIATAMLIALIAALLIREKQKSQNAH